MIKLIDLYHDNDFKPGELKMEGYSGVIFKAGQGSWADVPRYCPDWWQLAKDEGFLVGWYWLLDSRYHSSSHIDEMDKFHVFADIGELGLWVDVEKPRISMSESEYWKTPYAGHQNLIDFVYLLTQEGVLPGIYTSPGSYGLVMRDAPATAHEYLSQFDLWTAQYYYDYVEGVSKPKLYGKWDNWVLWQYQEGPDINIFNGTDEEFMAKYGQITPPITGEDGMYKGTVLTTNLNIRPQPSTSQPSLGKLLNGDKIEASEKVNGWWKLVKITRGVQDIPLPAQECYAYEGSTGAYIRTDAVITDPPGGGGTTEDVEVVVTVSGETVTVKVNGVEYHK